MPSRSKRKNGGDSGTRTRFNGMKARFLTHGRNRQYEKAPALWARASEKSNALPPA